MSYDDTQKERGVKRPQMTSNDLKRLQLTSKKPTNENVISPRNKNKNSFKAGSVHKIFEIND